MKKRTGFNPKRHVAASEATSAAQRASLAASAAYTGSRAHKRSPGNFGLGPAMSPRPGATLCDEAGVTHKQVARELLRAGIEMGMVSRQMRDGWPQNIWAVSDDSVPFEAELENPLKGEYHGYPMQFDDGFRDVVLDEWKRRHQ